MVDFDALAVIEEKVRTTLDGLSELERNIAYFYLYASDWRNGNMGSRRLDDLDSRFRPIAMELIARCAEAGIPVCVVNTLRNEKEQQENILRGVSWTMNSKHLPQPPEGKSLAIDIAPYSQYQLHGPDKIAWSGDDPAWETIGRLAEGIPGLRWGGRWRQRDLGHVEYGP